MASVIDTVCRVGWNGALDKAIELEKSRNVPDPNRVRDLEALKWSPS